MKKVCLIAAALSVFFSLAVEEVPLAQVDEAVNQKSGEKGTPEREVTPAQLDEEKTKVVLGKWDMKECPVCMEDFEEGEDFFVTKCGHYAHRHCARGWFLGHQHCMNCRQPQGENFLNEAFPGRREARRESGDMTPDERDPDLDERLRNAPWHIPDWLPDPAPKPYPKAEPADHGHWGSGSGGNRGGGGDGERQDRKEERQGGEPGETKSWNPLSMLPQEGGMYWLLLFAVAAGLAALVTIPVILVLIYCRRDSGNDGMRKSSSEAPILGAAEDSAEEEEEDEEDVQRFLRGQSNWGSSVRYLEDRPPSEWPGAGLRTNSK